MKLNVAAEAIESTRVLPDFDPKRSALLLIHWQNDVVTPEGGFAKHFADEVARSGALERVVSLVDLAREAEVTIAYVNVGYRGDHADNLANSPVFAFAKSVRAFAPQSKGAAVLPQLAPHPEDIQVRHGRISGFVGNDLDYQLRARGIDTLFLTGVATNVAVEGTARTAIDLGYWSVVGEDCCVAADPARHSASIASMRAIVSEVVTSAALKDALAKAVSDGS